MVRGDFVVKLELGLLVLKFGCLEFGARDLELKVDFIVLAKLGQFSVLLFEFFEV